MSRKSTSKSPDVQVETKSPHKRLNSGKNLQNLLRIIHIERRFVAKSADVVARKVPGSTSKFVRPRQSRPYSKVARLNAANPNKQPAYRNRFLVFLTISRFRLTTAATVAKSTAQVRRSEKHNRPAPIPSQETEAIALPKRNLGSKENLSYAKQRFNTLNHAFR